MPKAARETVREQLFISSPLESNYIDASAKHSYRASERAKSVNDCERGRESNEIYAF
jgi:hypothetical protein